MAKNEYQTRMKEVQQELEKLRKKEYNIRKAFYQSLPITEAFEITPNKKDKRAGEN